MASSLNKNIKVSNFGNSFAGIGNVTGGSSIGVVGGGCVTKVSGKVAAAAAAHNAHSPDNDMHVVSSSSGSNVPVAGGSSNITIPIIRSKDSAKLLPTYAAALQRNAADEYLAAEDLDNIQLELETLLSNVALRARVLKTEYESIDKDEKRNDRRNKEKQPLSPATGHISNGGLGGSSNAIGSGNGGLVGSSASSTTAGLNGKRKRDEPAAVRKKHSSMTILKQAHQHSKHAKNSPLAVHTDDSMDYMPAAAGVSGAAASSASLGNHVRSEYQLPKMSMPKNDMPNKFWLSVEPYCMPLTNEDLRLIDDLLEQYKGPLVPPIPSLGPHYSTAWANDDLKELQQSTSTSNRRKSHSSSNGATAGGVSAAAAIGTAAASAAGPTGAMLKKADSMLDDCVTGPLTQRLVSALIEEQMISHPSEQAAVGEHSNSSSSENAHNALTTTSGAVAGVATMPHNNLRSLTMLKNCIGIENRVKKELIEQGILNMGDFPHNEEDEVLYEIRRISAEISSVAQHNSMELKQLRVAAANEIKRIELKRKLDIIDQEILEAYKRMLQYRAKRKCFSVDEQQEIYRLTSEQRTLTEQLERLQPQSL